MCVNKNERVDNIGFGKLKLIQEPEEFCYGIDAVILADFVASISKKAENTMDLGTGSGIIPLILSHKFQEGSITGVELQKQSANRAVRSVNINGLQNRIKIINDDIINMPLRYENTMNVVVANPPYMIKDGAITNTHKAKAIARHETTATLQDFLRVASKLLMDKGAFFMVHRPFRMVDILTFGREFNLEAKTMQMVSAREGEPPNILLVHFVKNGGKEVKILKPLIVYNENNEYTEEIIKIYEK